MTDTFNCVLKTETDGMPASRVLCMVLLDIDRNNIHRFGPGYEDMAVGLQLLSYADTVIEHSDFHSSTIAKLYGLVIPPDKLFNTLELARDHLGESRNSLSDWATRLGLQRYKFRGSNTLTPSVMRHCEADAIIVARLFGRILAKAAAV